MASVVTVSDSSAASIVSSATRSGTPMAARNVYFAPCRLTSASVFQPGIGVDARRRSPA